MRRKPRLTRLQSVYYRGSVFFITCCIAHRRPLLANSQIQQAFADFCSLALARDILVGRYVIMPDHLHFFVHLSDPGELGTWIKSLKNSLSKILRARACAVPHWQKGYFDRLLRTEESFVEKWEYVRLNPIRAGLVDDVCHWPYQGEIAMLE